jgi:hypothetical protein
VYLFDKKVNIKFLKRKKIKNEKEFKRQASSPKPCYIITLFEQINSNIPATPTAKF